MVIYKAGVIGAGAMGSEIAQTISFAGIPVLLKDLNGQLVQSGLGRAQQIYERRLEKGKMTREELEKKMALIRPTIRYSDFKDVDLVIEAIVEDLKTKKQVFQELDQVCPTHTILASNTSSLSISELGSSTRRPEKVVGMHFFYPAHVMKLVEVIPGLGTSLETVEDVMAFSENLRKLPIRVNECAGFLVNRLLMPYLNEAAYALQEGSVTPAALDMAMVDFGFPMGPFTLVDTVGLDICDSVVKILLEDYGARMRPAEIWELLYKAGRYGAKRKKGFYTYGSQGEKLEVDAEIATFIQDLSKRPKSPSRPFSVERVLLPMINEAALAVQEKISNPADIDLAMMAGLGFPQEKGGILHYADQLGIDAIVRQLEEWHSYLGERFWPAPLLRRMVRANHLGVKTKKGFFDYP